MRTAMGIGLALLVGLAPSLAIADGSGGGGEPKAGASERPVDPDYTAGVKAIEAGDFHAAIRLLDSVVARDAGNANAFNWLAYATRKAGDPAKSIPIYEKALAIDPKHRGAHEYIGEAYLALGDLARAKEHLARLDSLCLFSCSEYRDLKKAIQAYERRRGGAEPAGR